MASTLDRMTRAADLMVKNGLTVKESSGYEKRGRPYTFYGDKGIVCHHTAAADDADSVLINGRSDLPGPLCHYALHRDGTVVLIAAGYANHAGASRSGAPSNSTGWGIEATGPYPNNDAYGIQAFPNYDEYTVMVACILDVEGWGTDRVFGHKESCDPPGRKGDPYFDMDPFRSEVAKGGGAGEDDLSAEAERQIKAIYDAMVVPGSTDPSDPYEKNYDRVKQLIAALNVSGTTSAEQAMEILFARIRNLEDGMDLVCANLDIPFEQVDTSKL